MSASTSKNFLSLSIGFAMFSMFFGAGNVVFPLAIGQIARDQNVYAVLGLVITGVFIPFIGLIAMSLFDGNYEKFFCRVGRFPGLILIILIMSLIGPFGAIPRTLTLSYSTIKCYLPEIISLPVFSILSCVIIFACTIKESSIVDLIGKFLTPVLLFSLSLIIVLGCYWADDINLLSDLSFGDSFLLGLKEGYNTMDLPGALFFSSVVLLGIKAHLDKGDAQGSDSMGLLLRSSAIGATLLAAVYAGFSFIAAFYAEDITNTPQEELLGVIGRQILGPYGGIVASIAVALACLTTAIALTAVFADFLRITVCKEKITYFTSLLVTISVSWAISTLDFGGIATIIVPIVSICYPGLIVMSFLNFAHKMWGWTIIKTPVYLCFAISLLNYYSVI
ncbi:MAG: branched-chain amino acid transporter [Waddliaceae bacterium]|nr:branched-chain amino acid transporter [Waddliaceae bacterium]